MRRYMWNDAPTVEVMGKAPYSPYVWEMIGSGETAPSLYPPELSEIAGRLTRNIHPAFVYMIFPQHEHPKKRLEEGPPSWTWIAVGPTSSAGSPGSTRQAYSLG